MSAEDFRKRLQAINADIDGTLAEVGKLKDETVRVQNVMRNTRQILDDLDEQFERQTGLTTLDVTIMFTAIGLQIARQYLLTKFPDRLDDQTAADNTILHGEEHSGRRHRLYNPSIEEIMSNPVPFDANIGADGALSGGGKLGHRATAIGHDPVIGLVIGTANIATSTLTTSSFDSWHISTDDVLHRDAFAQKASTALVLSKTGHKLLSEGIEGKKKVGLSLVKEVVHLKSDLNTKNSLPFPGVSAFNPQLASELASYGFDMANIVTVGKQMSMAMFINSVIAMIHGVFYEGSTSMDRKLYEVRTRKILSYSNLAASASNLAVVAITRDFTKLDLGGLAVTIYRLITDRKFIHDVKHEFIFGSYRDMIMGDYP